MLLIFKGRKSADEARGSDDVTRFTNETMIQEFGAMLETTPLDKITVSSIIEACDISRNTFYYHFHDIYDLLNAWMREEKARFVDPAHEFDSWQDVFKAFLKSAREHKAKIYHIFNSTNRDRLERYFNEILGEGMYQIVCKQGEGLDISKDDLKKVSVFYRDMTLGFFLRYLWSDMSFDAEGDIDRLDELFEGNIRRALETCAADTKRE